jgi:hypothetical protein
MYVEAYLLAGAENARIAAATRYPESVIQAYHDLFFDVRDGLSSPAWICATIFRGSPSTGGHKLDAHGLHLRLAWLGGEELLAMFIQAKRFDAAGLRLVQDVMCTNLMKMGVLLSFSSGIDKETTGLLVTLIGHGRDSGVSEQNVITDNIAQLITETGSLIGLAVPDDTRNLTLSAREPRVYELLNEPAPSPR